MAAVTRPLPPPPAASLSSCPAPARLLPANFQLSETPAPRPPWAGRPLSVTHRITFDECLPEQTLNPACPVQGRVDGAARGLGGSMHMYKAENNFYGGEGIVGDQVSLRPCLGLLHDPALHSLDASVPACCCNAAHMQSLRI